MLWLASNVKVFALLIWISGQKKFERILKQPNTASDAYRWEFSLFITLLSLLQPQSYRFGERVAADFAPTVQGQGEGEEVPGQGAGDVQIRAEERPQKHMGGKRNRGRVGTQGVYPGGEGHICSGDKKHNFSQKFP